MNYARRQWLVLAVGLTGLAGSLVMGQVLLARRGWRLDLTPEKRYVLSENSRRILANLDHDLVITALLRADDPRNREIEDLLSRARFASDRVHYRLVDVNRNPGVVRRFGAVAYGSLVVEADGRRKVFPNPTEQSLMTAIVQVTRPGRRRVYFLTGHGEHRIVDRDPRSGYSNAQAALIQELYDVAELGVLGDRPVPADASAIIIAGPRSDLLAGELLGLDAYLRRGGGLLVLVDPGDAPGLGAFLRRYGVVVSDDVVLDPENRLFAGDFLTMVIPERSSAHPVTAGLQAAPLMSQIRGLSVTPAELALAGLEILRSAPVSWRTPDPSVLQTGAGQFVPGRDVRGPVAVGASVVLRGDGHPGGRILVYGDSDFANNSLLDYLGNRDLFLNSVNWLAGEQVSMASRPAAKTPGIGQLFISARQGAFAFWLGTVIQPAIVLVIGVVVCARQRWRG